MTASLNQDLSNLREGAFLQFERRVPGSRSGKPQAEASMGCPLSVARTVYSKLIADVPPEGTVVHSFYR